MIPGNVSPDTAIVSDFVTRCGADLYLNGSKFRFAGANIYWLGLAGEQEVAHYPTPFRIDNALATALEMGATVVRTWAFVAPHPATDEEQSGFQALDYAIKSAADHNIRLLLVLTNNWCTPSYYPGRRQAFVQPEQPEDEFYTAPEALTKFLAYISQILNHKNALTGLAYHADPTIMAWEIGNELRLTQGADQSQWRYAAWTEAVAKHIKRIAPDQLVADGHSAQELATLQESIKLDAASLALPEVDLYSSHIYPMKVDLLQRDAKQVTDKNKVYFVGEYAWYSGRPEELGDLGLLTSFLGEIENGPGSGDFYWSLFSHADEYGFVDHCDVDCDDPTKKRSWTLHYPGNKQKLKPWIQQLRTHAYKMRSQITPPHQIPRAPLLHPIVLGNAKPLLRWQGVVAADHYVISRTTDLQRPLEIVGDPVDEYHLPWSDSSAEPGVRYEYRVHAVNLDGQAGSDSNSQPSP